MFGRFEPLHLQFAAPGGPMRILRFIVQISALSVLYAGKQLALSDAIAPQLIGHDHSGHILQTLQQPLGETLRGAGIAPRLNENVEHDAIRVDGAPETVLHTLDPDENFIHAPLVPWPWSPASQAVGETRAEFLAPASHRLVGDDDTALSQCPFNISQAEAEHVAQPGGVADDLGGEPMKEAGVGWPLHAASLARLRTGDQSWLL